MKRDGIRPRHWARSLRTRLIAFLTIALLPLGVIAVLQTVQVLQEAERLAERDLLSRTTRAASEQAGVLRRAFGAAEALGFAAAELQDNPDACSRIMGDFTDRQPTFVFAGFIPADGLMACNSLGATIDYSGRPDWQDFVANPRRLMDFNAEGDASGQPVFVILAPITAPIRVPMNATAKLIRHPSSSRASRSRPSRSVPSG